jgi:hypothetical protein
MRTVATAVESYSVDQNKYAYYRNPLDPDYPAYSGRASSSMPHFTHRISVGLTTPIAYISSLPRDPFTRKATLGPTEPVELGPTPFIYSNDQDGSANLSAKPGSINNFPVRYLYTIITAPNIAFSSAYSCVNDSLVWCTISHGPDLVDNNPDDNMITTTAYDPTNGSVSAGDIYYFGPGVGPT